MNTIQTPIVSESRGEPKKLRMCYTHTSVVTYALQERGDDARALSERVERLNRGGRGVVRGLRGCLINHDLKRTQDHESGHKGEVSWAAVSRGPGDARKRSAARDE